MIDPKCLNGEMEYFYSAEDYLLPCCWCGEFVAKPESNDPKIQSLMTNKLSEVDSVEQIVESKEWKEFWDILFDDPNNAPVPCKSKCGVSKGEKLRNWSETENYRYDIDKDDTGKKIDNNKGYIGS